jgi:hypothetical protein
MLQCCFVIYFYTNSKCKDEVKMNVSDHCYANQQNVCNVLLRSVSRTTEWVNLANMQRWEKVREV